MKKILFPEQIYEADKQTLLHEGISELELMERAASKCYAFIKNKIKKEDKIHIFCGPGNNGGDGLVIARLLDADGYSVNVHMVASSTNYSKAFEANLSRLEKTNVNVSHFKDCVKIEEKDVIIDCIFGIGLSREPEGVFLEAIQCINQSKALSISIDFPSGLFADKSVKNKNAVVKADYTLTFQVPKLAFLLPFSYPFTGKIKIIDIGLDKDYLKNVEIKYAILEKKDIRKKLRHREKYSHKGTFGHALMVGGSFGKTGAVLLSAKGALRSGTGLVSCWVPQCAYTILQTSFPEAMVEVDDNESFLTNMKWNILPTAIGIGPGMGTQKPTQKAFGQFLKDAKEPLVIDADALNILSKNKEFLKELPKDSILTPHPKEFERLVGKSEDDFDQLEKLISFSKKHQVIVVLKGANTAICSQGTVVFNSTGNPGMATGGSGDVLTGIITGFLAQGYCPLDAALIGVYIHGLSGDLALKQESEESLIASDMIKNLGKAFQKLKK